MQTKRKATFYINDKIHKALRLKAANDDLSPSDLLNQLLAEELIEYMEDLEDVIAVKDRQKERSRAIPLDKVIKKLSKNG